MADQHWDWSEREELLWLIQALGYCKRVLAPGSHLSVMSADASWPLDLQYFRSYWLTYMHTEFGNNYVVEDDVKT